jgi:hypothetical protein
MEGEGMDGRVVVLTIKVHRLKYLFNLESMQ